MLFQEFLLDPVAVQAGAEATRIVGINALRCGRSLFDLDVIGDDGFEDISGRVDIAQLFAHRLLQRCAPIFLGDQHADHLQPDVLTFLNLFDQLFHLMQRRHSQATALGRNQGIIGRHQSVLGQNTQVGRRIDDDPAIRRRQALDNLGQTVGDLGLGHALKGRIRRQDVDVLVVNG